MRRLWIVAIVAVLAAGVARGQQSTSARTSASVQLEAAIKKEVVDGDVKVAIELYRKLAKSSDRAVAAQALLRMAECYQKLGDAQAQKIYEQIVREYADQKETVTLARARIGAGARAFGLLCKDCGDSEGSLSRDGRWMATTEWVESGDLAMRDMATGQVTRLLAKTGSWKDSGEFAEAPVLSPDMQQIVYVWFTGQRGVPTQLRIIAKERGAKPRTLLNSPEFVWPSPVAWSADAKQVLTELQKEDKTWQLAWVSVADGTVKVLKSLEWRISGVDSRSTISPDGRFIAYSALAKNPTNAPPAARDSAGMHLYILAADGSSDTELTKTAGIDEAPVWTPDGSFLLFRSDRTGSFDLWALPMREGKAAGLPSLVKRDIGRGAALGITNSGAYHYFQSTTVQQFYMASVDQASGKVTGVPTRVSDMDYNCGWTESPDRHSIAYAAKVMKGTTSVDAPCSLLIIRSVADGRERVVPHDLTELRWPQWSPDGRRFLVFGKKDAAYGVFTIDQASSATTLLVPNANNPVAGEFAMKAFWHPDGKGIYVPRLEGGMFAAGARYRMMYHDLATGQETERFSLTYPAYFWFSTTSVSPDGSLCLLVNESDGARSAVVVPAGGGEARRVFTARAPNTLSNAKFAADARGLWIIQRHSTPENPNVRQIMWVPMDGGGPRYAGLTADGISALGVSPDGEWLSYIAFGAVNELWALDVSSLLKRPR